MVARSSGAWRPIGQGEQSVSSFAKRPAWQSLHALAPAAADWPSSHGVQALDPMERALVPAGQSWQYSLKPTDCASVSFHCGALANFPAAHGSHVMDPLYRVKVAMGQAVQVSAPFAAANRPCSHAVQSAPCLAYVPA
jgi:hypothetical protein